MSRMYKRLFRILLVFAYVLVAQGCERRLGKQVFSEAREMGKFRFLVTKWEDANYPEYSTTFWCSTRETRENRPSKHNLDNVQPPRFRDQGYMLFGGYGEMKTPNFVQPSFDEIQVVNDSTAFFPRGMTITFDSCRTRIHFNISEGAIFADTMRGKAIRFPESQIFGHPPFFTELIAFKDGGCLRINRLRIDDQNHYFYCTKDLGKSWTLETTEPK
jgi:hypothetical protein